MQKLIVVMLYYYVLQVAIYISIAALTAYTKLSIAVQLHSNDNNDTALFLAGAITQLGSLLGSVLFFILVFYTHIYSPKDL